MLSRNLGRSCCQGAWGDHVVKEPGEVKSSRSRGSHVVKEPGEDMLSRSLGGHVVKEPGEDMLSRSPGEVEPASSLLSNYLCLVQLTRLSSLFTARGNH